MKLLFYTGSFTHQFYKEQFNFFPEKIDVIASTPDLVDNEQMRKDYLSKSGLFALLVDNLGLRAVKFFKIPKYFKIDSKGADFIFSCQYLIKNNIPYVSDFEHIAAYGWYSQKLFDSPVFQKKLRKIFLNKNLKFLLPWTKAAKESLIKNMNCTEFEHKIKVIYPAIEEKKFKKISHTGVNILFIGGSFYFKGGMDAILAFMKIKSEISYVKFTIISSGVPSEIIHKYKNIIDFKSKISQEELKKEYYKADIFLLPTHMDTFGFVFLEAMAYGLPCVSIKHFAVPEIITNGVTGFVVDSEISLYDKNFKYKYNIVNRKEEDKFTEICKNPSSKDINTLADALKKLIINKSLRSKMSNNCLKEVRTGRFSKVRRIKELKALFKDSQVV